MRSGPVSLLTLAIALLLPSGGCKRGLDVDAMLEMPSGQVGVPLPADALPGDVSHLEDALQLPQSSLPEWLDRCALFQQPVPPGLGDSTRVGAVCGPHALLIASMDRDRYPATDAQARAQATSLLAAGAETRRETRPGRDGLLGVDVVRADGQVVGMAAGSETARRVIGLACAGPEAVKTRAAFCEAAIAALIAVPAGKGTGESVPVGEVSMGLPASGETRAYFDRVDPAVPLDVWTAELAPARVRAEGRFSGEAEDATRIASWLIGESELLFCLTREPDLLRRYPRRGVVELAWVPGHGGHAFIGGQDPPILACLQAVLPRLGEQVRAPALPVRLQLGFEVVRTEP